MSLIMWLKEPGRRGQLLWQLYGEDSETALKALGELREQGWLEDTSLRGVDLREANLPGADLREVDLEEVNLGYANLKKADLSLAELAEAVLVEANLKEANLTETNLYDANLREADLTGANLDGALLDRADLKFATITEEQLRQADALAGAIMPDGSSYDGRFQLEGDLFKAAEQGFDLADPESMANFYSIPLAFYQKGQEWAKEHPKPTAPSTGGDGDEQEDESDEIVKAVTYSPWNPLDYFSLILDIFNNPEEVLEYRQNPVMRDNLRVMSAWLASTLIWLPGIISGLISLPSIFHRFGGQFTASALWLVVSISAIVVIAGWLLTGIASQKRRGEEKLTRIFAIVIAVLGSIGLDPVIGLCTLIGYVFGLTVIQRFARRSARITLSWVAMLYMAGLWGTLYYEIFLPPLQSIGILTSSISALAFSLTRFIFAALTILILQSIVKSILLRQLDKHQPIGGALLIIGYVGAFALVIWRAIVAIQ